MAIQTLMLAALAGSASAVKLYVSNYNGAQPNGDVSVLEFTPGVAQGQRAAQLKVLSSMQGCGNEPTWLDQSPPDSNIYCVDEGWSTPNASLSALKKNADGSLSKLFSTLTIQGPVASQFYNDYKYVAIAHYGGSAISTFKVNSNSFTPVQNFTFAVKGPRPEQEASHVHHAVIDPTKQFIVFPDLGADLTHVYKICKDTGLLTAQEPIKTTLGYGPRHATFWSPDQVTDKNARIYLFVIHELANKLISYKVNYSNSGVSFTKVQESGLYGDKADPIGTRAAEIVVSPDNKFIVGSNRNATIFSVKNYDASNSTMIPSDSLTTFQPAANGSFKFVGLAASGGSFPRHFSFNKDGSLVAVGNQNSVPSTVDIFPRDVSSGKIGDRIASAKLPGAVNNVIWEA
jgi:6-phosphogluconolactonase (cycloisomerase 2 family)